MHTPTGRNRPFRRRAIRSVDDTGDVIARTIAGGAASYDRKIHLPRLLPVGPDEIADESEPARRAILIRLARAMRAERVRGRAGHWTYDLSRHIALLQAYVAERRDLKSAVSGQPDAKTPPPGSGDGD